MERAASASHWTALLHFLLLGFFFLQPLLQHSAFSISCYQLTLTTNCTTRLVFVPVSAGDAIVRNGVPEAGHGNEVHVIERVQHFSAELEVAPADEPASCFAMLMSCCWKSWTGDGERLAVPQSPTLFATSMQSGPLAGPKYRPEGAPPRSVPGGRRRAHAERLDRLVDDVLRAACRRTCSHRRTGACTCPARRRPSCHTGGRCRGWRADRSGGATRGRTSSRR